MELKDRRKKIMSIMYPNLENETHNNDKIVQQEIQRREEKAAKKNELLNNSLSYSLFIDHPLWVDIGDAVLGFIIPGVGDTITSLLQLPSLYVAIFKIRSMPLVLAILNNLVIDWLVGLIPVLGDLIDAFYCSNRKNAIMIKGFIDDDKKVIKEVNGKAWQSVICMAIVILFFYFTYSWICSLFS